MLDCTVQSNGQSNICLKFMRLNIAKFKTFCLIVTIFQFFTMRRIAIFFLMSFHVKFEQRICITQCIFALNAYST